MSNASPITATIADSAVTLSQVVFPKDTNELKHATAGYVLKLIDITGSLAARYHCKANTVTASLDYFNFSNPVEEWDLISASAKLTQVWKSSMEVEVTVTSKHYHTMQEDLIAKGYMVFVTLDGQMKPITAPPLVFTNPEEQLLAQTADLRKHNRLLEKQHWGEREKTVIDASENPETISRLMNPNDANVYQNVFGGVILEMAHDTSKKAAKAYAKTHVTSVRQERMSFEQPAIIGEILEARAIVTATWNSSIETQVELYAKANTEDAPYRLIASSFLVFVALDDQGKPVTVPHFEAKTDKQKLRDEQAQIRRQQRLAEKQTAQAYKPQS